MNRRSFLLSSAGAGALVLTGLPALAATKKIDLTYIVEIPPIDAAKKGIVDALAKAGFVVGKTISLNVQSAQGSMPTQMQIAKTFVGEDPALMIAISTPSAQACQAAAKGTIPIVFSAVTDPVAAKLVASMEKPGGTITGTSDQQPMGLTFDLIATLTPKARTIGVLYNAGEANSVAQVDEMKAIAKTRGLTIVTATAANTGMVPAAAQSLAGRVDAILVPTDSTVVSSIQSVVKVGEEAKIPVYASDTDSVKKGAMAALGFNYYKLGLLTGEIAAKVLNGANPGGIPVGTLHDEDLYLNLGSARKMGVTIPKAEIARAAKVIGA